MWKKTSPNAHDMTWTFNLIFMHIKLHVNYWSALVAEGKLKVFNYTKHKTLRITRVEEKQQNGNGKPSYAKIRISANKLWHQNPILWCNAGKRIISYFLRLNFISFPSIINRRRRRRSLCPQFLKDFSFSLLVQHIERESRETKSFIRIFAQV